MNVHEGFGGVLDPPFFPGMCGKRVLALRTTQMHGFHRELSNDIGLAGSAITLNTGPRIGEHLRGVGSMNSWCDSARCGNA